MTTKAQEEIDKKRTIEKSTREQKKKNMTQRREQRRTDGKEEQTKKARDKHKEKEREKGKSKEFAARGKPTKHFASLIPEAKTGWCLPSREFPNKKT